MHATGLLTEVKHIKMPRQNITPTVMAMYEEMPTCFSTLSIQFEGEQGQDAGGLTKDMFAHFWNTALQEWFHGEHCMVPFVSPDSSGEGIFEVLGRVLTHSLLLVESLPLKMSRSFVISTFKQATIPDDDLIKDFLLFISPAESQLLRSALKYRGTTFSKSVQTRLEDLFARYMYNMLLFKTTCTMLTNLKRVNCSGMYHYQFKYYQLTCTCTLTCSSYIFTHYPHCSCQIPDIKYRIKSLIQE